MNASAATGAAPLPRLLVAECGERIGVAACGSLLAQLGAEVVLIEPRQRRAAHKWCNRPVTAAGKRSVALDPHAAHDAPLLDELLRCSDVVLLSSDVSPAPVRDWHPQQIVCDITAFGTTGPLAGLPYSDALVQAASGIADTTGDPAGSPTPVGFPILEFCTGIYAAAAVVAALRVRRLHGFGQPIEIALFDCAVSTLSTFLPFHVVGEVVTRAGNRHSLAAPWNAYRAADGWVLICTATDEHWRRLCATIRRPELGRAEGYATNAERVARRAEVDALVQQWVSTQTVRECIECLSAIEIACGPIVTVEQLARDENLLRRRMIRRVRDPSSGHEVAVPGSPLKASRSPGRAPDRIPRPDEDRAYIAALCETRMIAQPPFGSAEAAPRPLAGLRVIEIGQFTTAPLVARQLGALGAEVLKVESPGGEGSRGWPPGQGDQGYFFTFSNSDKRSLMLDLRDQRDKAAFRALLQTGDVLVENLKPGSLARLGFDAEQLAAINPRLVYCGVSGFGADSVYPGRPAFDTVVQAMSGFMDLTRVGGTPTKAGISAADIVGGEFALLAILAALEHRDRTGHGQALDISMQDVAAWVTQTTWNTAAAQSVAAVRCADGFALVECEEAQLARGLARHDVRFGSGLAAAQGFPRTAFVALAQRAGFAAAPALSVTEVAESGQAGERQLIISSIGDDGRKWPLLNSPLRLKLTSPVVAKPIGKLGEANEEVIRTLGQPAAVN